MSTWRRGREAMFERLYRGAPSLRSFLTSLSKRPPTRVPGTAVFLTANPAAVPRALLHNLKHNKVLHERVVVLKVETEDVPGCRPRSGWRSSIWARTSTASWSATASWSSRT